MRNIEEMMTVVHKENKYAKVNTLKKINIMRAATSPSKHNDVIGARNDSLFKLGTSLNSKLEF